jgi:pyridoxine 5-phosphate synthase
MTRLSVNINKVAVIRNSRGGNLPNLVQVAMDCEKFGAEGITVHPRPDERHIRYSDLQPLKEVVTTEFNIEGYPDVKFMQKVLEIKPHQCTLVPDPPGVLTSSEGWNTILHQEFLKTTIAKLQDAGIRVSLFLDANPVQVEGAYKTGTDRIEFYTGTFAEEYAKGSNIEIQKHIEAAKLAKSMNLGVNAGHDLNLHNLSFYKNSIENLMEVSIGHALISDSLYYGLQNTIKMYKHQLK